MNSLNQVLAQLFERDLLRLRQEILLYKKEENMWVISGNINNSGGNLCLHLIGNLKTFIGNGLSTIGYRRDRPFEFEGKNVPRQTLIADLEDTILIVKTSIASLSDQDILTKDFPIVIWEEKTKMHFTLLHLHSHLNYHLGQVNYHRRMIDISS